MIWPWISRAPEADQRTGRLPTMNSMVDRHVGELLGLLEELKIDDNTIVFFTSDNGAARPWPGILDSCGELKGFEGSSYEGGIRVPMVVRWPGKLKASTVSDLPWYFPDVMPTLAELAGVSNEVPKDTDDTDTGREQDIETLGKPAPLRADCTRLIYRRDRFSHTLQL